VSVELLLAASLVLTLDHASKRLVASRLGGSRCVPAGPGPRLRPVANPRLGLGLFREPRTLLGVWGAAVLGILLLIHFTPSFQGPVAQAGLGAALGGATGNVLERLRYGAVLDFVDLRIWPVFNVADAAIVLGVAVALWSMQ
jgi:signal peptidase II